MARGKKAAGAKKGKYSRHAKVSLMWGDHQATCCYGGWPVPVQGAGEQGPWYCAPLSRLSDDDYDANPCHV